MADRLTIEVDKLKEINISAEKIVLFLAFPQQKIEFHKKEHTNAEVAYRAFTIPPLWHFFTLSKI